MDPNSAGQSSPSSLSEDSLPLFAEVVHLVLLQWTVLRLAVENEWGGRNSSQKFGQLETDILSWFTSSKEIEDGSIEEVAEQLVIVHEECLHENFGALFKLRASNSRGHGVYGNRQVAESADEDKDLASEMDVKTNDIVDRSSAYGPNSQIEMQNGGNVVRKSHDHASNISMNLNGRPSVDAADGWTLAQTPYNHPQAR